MYVDYAGDDAMDPLDADTPPDFLAIGHATRDLLPGGGWRLGGTVTFAARTAERLGLRAGVVTSAPPDLLAALRAALPETAIVNTPSAEATTFENIYHGGARQQFLRAQAAPLTRESVPPAWRNAPVVLLAPLAREVDPALASAFPTSLVAATPQGWLRRWDDGGAVSPGALDGAAEALPRLAALILSREDLPPAEAGALLAAWARRVPHVLVTRGAEGALLLRPDAAPEVFPGYPVREVDPTGAGDVFATAFLCELRATGDPRAAIDFANRVAALSVEQPGATGIPTRAEVSARFGNRG